MDEFEVSRRRFVTGAGAASVGLTVALLPSAVAATSGSGPTTTAVTILSTSGQFVAVTQKDVGGTKVNELRIEWFETNTGQPVAFTYQISGPIDSTLSGSSSNGYVPGPNQFSFLTVPGWSTGESLTIILTRTSDGGQYPTQTFTHS